MSHLCLYVHPNLEDLDLSIQRFQSDVTHAGFDNDYAFQISVCLAEVLNNIVEHSPKEVINQNSLIEVNCQIFQQVIMLCVRHRAPPVEVKSRSESEDGVSYRGRGMHIVESWMDEVALTHKDGVNHFNMIKMR